MKFSDIFEFQNKSGIKAGEGLKQGRYFFYTSSDEQTKFLNEYLFEGDALIFGTGGNASVHFIDQKFAVSTDCLVSQPKDKRKVYAKFYYYFLRGNMRILERGFKGAGLKHISKSYISAIELPKVDFDRQKTVVEILNQADALRQKRKQSLQLLDDFLRAMFLDMFGDPRSGSKWKIIDFGEIIDVLTDYHANGSYEILREHVALKSTPDYALMVRTTDLENNNFTDAVKYISKDAYEFLKKSKVYGGEIIINKIGSAGNVYLMPYLNRPVSLGMNAFLLRFNKSANTIYIYHALTSDYGKMIIDAKVQGAVTKTIRKDAIRSLKIPLPPIELQNKFASIVAQVEQTQRNMQISRAELNSQFNALTQRYFG